MQWGAGELKDKKPAMFREILTSKWSKNNSNKLHVRGYAEFLPGVARSFADICGARVCRIGEQESNSYQKEALWRQSIWKNNIKTRIRETCFIINKL